MLIDYKKRIAALEGEIRKRSLDSFLVTDETNVSYLSGFEGRDSTLLFTPRERYFITDSRYIEDAKDAVRSFSLELVEASNYETLERLIKKSRLKKIGFESMNLPYEVVNRLKLLIGKAKFMPFKNLIETLRSVKDRTEIELIKNSIRLTKRVLDNVLKLIKPGISERSLSDRIEIEFIKNGARPSFRPIVAAGKNSSRPHARPEDVKLAPNSFVMVDIGCKLRGYNSDLTRMVILGRVKETFKKIYDIVRSAQRAALDNIRPGSRISEIDLAAREYIQEHGFGRYFGHSLGHGVGMEIHEEPTISKANHDTLKTGMVFTVEPAIYIPKFGGARLEDMVLVTDDGCEVLTR